jgi:hypothetical protein
LTSANAIRVVYVIGRPGSQNGHPGSLLGERILNKEDGGTIAKVIHLSSYLNYGVETERLLSNLFHHADDQT